MRIEPTHEHVDGIMKFLEDTLTEERTDALIALFRAKFNKFVPWFLRSLVWRYVDKALPEAILEPLETIMRSRVV